MVQKFTNIPYSEPPVGKLRFSKPLPKKPWNGTLNSTNEAIACWQEAKPGLNLTEDCLVLNIWTPYPQTPNTTVMVYIHGGAFRTGYSGAYLGHNFVAVGEVILVTINYRLSMLGFLSSGDERIKDEPTVLWDEGKVKKNDVILGITKDEMIIKQVPLLQRSRNIGVFVKEFEQMLNQLFKNSVSVQNQAQQLYQPKCVASLQDALRPIVGLDTNLTFLCPTEKEARQRSEMFNSSNLYLYQYSYLSPVPELRTYPQGTFGFVGHALDVLPTFGAPINDPEYPAEDQILSMRMILYWTNFAKNGDPNSGIKKLPVVVEKVDNLPKWPKYTNSSREYLDMESLSRMTVRRRLRETHCDFLRDPKGFTRDRGVKSVAIKHIAQVAVIVVALFYPIA